MILDILDWFKSYKPFDTKLFEGTVIDNDDPDKRGAIKCKIDGWLELDKEELPWIYPNRSTFLGSGTAGSSFAVPTIDSKVRIQFPFSQVYFGFYVGEGRTDVTNLPADEATSILEDYPNSYGWIDISGNRFKVNTTQNYTEFYHMSGTTIKIDEVGNMHVTVKGTYTVEADGIMTFKAPDILYNP